MKIEFYRHNIGNAEKERLIAALDSIFLTTGEEVYHFERQLSAYLGVPRSIGLMSCTAALQLALLAYGIGEGDEVITTPLTFIATANAILHAGAKPVFVDVEATTGNIDANLVTAAITPRTRAIIVVHLYGHMCDMSQLRAIADKHNLKLIEDAAHCLEGVRDGIRPGQLGDAACFSFYATKSITCGEGGAISVPNDEVAEEIRKLSLHGMSRSAADRYHGCYQHWDMELLGWKYNMSNLQAALLIPQLAHVEEYLTRREAICQRYEQAFMDMVAFPAVLPATKSARHLFTIWVAPIQRDEIMAALQARGIAVAVNYRAIHLLKYYREKYGFVAGTYPIAESIGASTITLPLYAKLIDREVDYIIDNVKAVIGNFS
jgi:UDP-4-amino-4-deoxy-L-arabinose-oxoglutarate aminotransferase